MIQRRHSIMTAVLTAVVATTWVGAVLTDYLVDQPKAGTTGAARV